MLDIQVNAVFVLLCWIIYPCIELYQNAKLLQKYCIYIFTSSFSTLIDLQPGAKMSTSHQQHTDNLLLTGWP